LEEITEIDSRKDTGPRKAEKEEAREKDREKKTTDRQIDIE